MTAGNSKFRWSSTRFLVTTRNCARHSCIHRSYAVWDHLFYSNSILCICVWGILPLSVQVWFTATCCLADTVPHTFYVCLIYNSVAHTWPIVQSETGGIRRCCLCHKNMKQRERYKILLTSCDLIQDIDHIMWFAYKDIGPISTQNTWDMSSISHRYTFLP